MGSDPVRDDPMPGDVSEEQNAHARRTLLADPTGAGSGGFGVETAGATAPSGAAVAPVAQVAQLRTPITLSMATLWSAAAVAVAVVAITVVIVKTFDFLLLMFFAITLAEAMRPAVDALERLRVPRVAGVLLVYLGSALALALLLWLLLVPLLDQLSAVQRELPHQLAALQQLGAQLQQAIGTRSDLAQVVANVERSAASDTGALAQALIAVPAAALSIPFAIFVVLSLALFWLTGADRMRPAMLDMLPAREHTRAERILGELSQGLGGYMRGVIVNTIAITGLTWLGLLILGVPYPLLLGLATGLLQVVPLIGPWISGAMVALTALASGGTPRMVAALAVFVALQQLEGAVLVPFIMSRSARLNPIVTLIATIIGGALLGFFGAVMAVPLAIVVQVVVGRIVVPWIQARAAHQSYQHQVESGSTA